MNVGYLMQNGAADLGTTSGPQLHVTAVIKGLERAGCRVRTVAIQQDTLQWSDDLVTWAAPRFGFSSMTTYRLGESCTRRAQTELKAPFLGLFDSLRFADACTQMLRSCHVLYERHGYLGYGGAIAARRLGVPLVLEMNGNILREIEERGVAMSPTQRRIGRWITRRTLLAAAHVVVVADALKRELVTSLGLPPSRISVVQNGVNLELFSRRFDPIPIRARLGIGNGPTIVFVGSFQPWHGVDLLVAAFDLLRDRFPATQLVLVGEGDGRDTVIGRIRELGLERHVVMTGRLEQEEVAAVTGTADVLVAPYPSLRTDIVGTPLKLLEYMAAGGAIVASTAPLHDVVVEGITAVRVEPASAIALAAGIARLLADEPMRARLGAAAWRQAQRYSWDGVAEQLKVILSTVLGGRTRATSLATAVTS